MLKKIVFLLLVAVQVQLVHAQSLVAGTISSNSSQTICSGSTGGTLTATAPSGGTGPYTYMWQYSDNGTSFFDIGGTNALTYTTPSLTASRYYRIVVNDGSTTTTSGSFLIGVNPLPTITATASPVSVISGGQSTLTAGGASTYSWSPTSGLSNSGVGQSVVATVTAQTTFTVTGTDANGCVNTATVTVNVQPLLAGTISGTQDVCAGATPSTITSSSLASGGSGSSYSYVWQEATDVGFTQGVSTISGETGTELSFSVATTSNSVTKYYRRGVKDASDPGSAYVYTTGVVKTIRQPPTVTVLKNPTTSVPAGASVTLTASAVGSGGYTFGWSNNATGSPTTVTPTVTTSYTATATDLYGCSAASSSVTVTVSPLDGGVIASTKNSVCTGSVPAAMTSSSPASGGTGVIAGGGMRAVFECAGVRNVLAKSYGSRNAINVVRATVKALASVRSPEEIAAKRGKSLEELTG